MRNQASEKVTGRKKVNQRKYIRYKEGARLYSMCQTKFERLARDAKAVIKIDKVALVNIDKFEEYLETFRVMD